MALRGKNGDGLVLLFFVCLHTSYRGCCLCFPCQSSGRNYQSPQSLRSLKRPGYGVFGAGPSVYLPLSSAWHAVVYSSAFGKAGVHYLTRHRSEWDSNPRTRGMDPLLYHLAIYDCCGCLICTRHSFKCMRESNPPSPGPKPGASP